MNARLIPCASLLAPILLLAGRNDQDAVARTGDGRAVNRHNFTMDEIEKAARRDVVRRLVDLILLRNGHPAFDGEFRVLDSAGSRLHLSWANGADTRGLYGHDGELQSSKRWVDALPPR